MDRRKFIGGMARGGIVALLAAFTGVLVTRHQVKPVEACLDNFQCRNCLKISRCNLPEAIKSKEHG